LAGKSSNLYFALRVFLEVLLAALGEVVYARVFNEGGEHEGEAHEQEDIERRRVGHLRDTRPTGEADSGRC